MPPDGVNVTGTLRHVGGVAGIAWHFGTDAWSATETPRGDHEVSNEWCDLLLSPDGDDVVLLGTVEPGRFDDLVAALGRTGATLSLALRDDGGGLVREAAVTDGTRAADEAAKRERFEREVAALVGLRILDVTYWDLAYDEPEEPAWDRGDWHHAVMGVELATDDGVVSVTWTRTFHPYGVETSRERLGADGTRGWNAGEHALWRARRDPVRGASTHWERVEVGEGRTSGGTVPMPARTVDVPYAVRLDFDAGPVWFVAAVPGDRGEQAFAGGDEVMVVFSAERMRGIGFPA